MTYLPNGWVFVPGTPKPQGSMRAFTNPKTGRPILTSDNPGTIPWRDRVVVTLRLHLEGSGILYPRPQPVSIGLEFVMPRRAAEPKRDTPPHTRKPDLDKLTRAMGDALTGILYEDDSQIVNYHQHEKRTAVVGEEPGVFLSWRSGLRIVKGDVA